MEASLSWPPPPRLPSPPPSPATKCNPAPGLVIGPKGNQAAIVFPQYPIGITTTGPDGSVTVDFSLTAEDDPNGKDWSACRLGECWRMGESGL